MVGSSTLASWTRKNCWLECFGKNKSGHKCVLAAVSTWYSVWRFIGPCPCALNVRVTGKPLWSENCGTMALRRCHFLLQRATLWILQYMLIEVSQRARHTPQGNSRLIWVSQCGCLNLNAPQPMNSIFFFFFSYS